MANFVKDQLRQATTTCDSLLYELQVIWDEVGESDADKDRLVLELEQECLDVYRRKVDQANRKRAQLRQAIADNEAELAAICSALSEPPVHIRQSTPNVGGLKEELKTIIPQLEEMRRRKNERLNQFAEIIEQIKTISLEIKPGAITLSEYRVEQSDLSLRKLEELNRELQCLQKEKCDRLNKLMENLRNLHSFCEVLGLDFKETVTEVHPSLKEADGPKNISDNTIERLANAIGRLREVKIQRMQKLQDLASTMLELWNLMDTPPEQQQIFQNITRNIAASEEEITEPNLLSIDFLNYVEDEVLQLEQLKASKMKELILKKKGELEELRRKTHLAGEEGVAEFTVEAIEAGAIDASMVLHHVEAQIAAVKEEAYSRKDILEKVDRWHAACEEEAWLEEYNRDDNRYNAGRGAHLALKRAEKARALVAKIPAMVDNLASKITAWEEERGVPFTYDGISLVTMLEDYMILRQEKEQEKKRQRDQKKIQGQIIVEQEALYGSKPSPSKQLSGKKMPRTSSIGGVPNRRVSLGSAVMHPPKPVDLQHCRSVRAVKKTATDDFSTLSPGSRGLDIVGLTAKKLSYNMAGYPREMPEAAASRKPLFQNNSAVTTACHLQPSFPNGTSEDEENRVPPALVPGTQKITTLAAAAPFQMTPTVLPMQVANTPMLAAVSLAPPAGAIVPTALTYETAFAPATVMPNEEIEISFEERRLAWYLSSS